MINEGYLVQDCGRYVYRNPSRNIVIWGAQPEWVLMAAAEVLSQIERAGAECEIVKRNAARHETPGGTVAAQAAEAALMERFDLLPQCIVSLGPVYYKWTGLEGLALKPHEFMAQAMQRLIDVGQKRTGRRQPALAGIAVDGPQAATAGLAKTRPD